MLHFYILSFTKLFLPRIVFHKNIAYIAQLYWLSQKIQHICSTNTTFITLILGKYHYINFLENCNFYFMSFLSLFVAPFPDRETFLCLTKKLPTCLRKCDSFFLVLLFYFPAIAFFFCKKSKRCWASLSSGAYSKALRKSASASAKRFSAVYRLPRPL